MSRDTSSTTLRCLNHFSRPWATSPSIVSSREMSVLARGHGLGARRRAVGAGPVLRLGGELRLHAPLLASLHHRAILGDIEVDGVAGDDVVLLPDAGIADEPGELLGLEVLGALSRPE